MTSVDRQCLGACGLVALALALAMGQARADNLDRDASRVLTEPSGQAPPTETARPGVGRATLAGSVDAATYRLGPGDLLSLEYGGRALEARTLAIDSEGRARIPNLGLVSLGGRTLGEARADVIKRLRPYVPGASVDLRLIQPRTFKVYVLGEVTRSGMQEVTGSARALEVIAAAGGTRPDGSRRNIRVLHRDGRVEVADLDRFESTGDWAGNPYLEDGDRVIVPTRVERFGIFGAVARPDTYEFRQGDSVSTAMRIAGGPLPAARLDSVLVLRFRGAQQLDTLVLRLEPGDEGVARALQADDRIFIRSKPEWRPTRHVTLIGEVLAPGVYAIEEGRSRISDLLRWSGGFTASAGRRSVRIERGGPDAERDLEFERLSRLTRAEMSTSEYRTFQSKLAVRQPSSLVDFSTGPPPPAADVLLRDGDRVEVPRLELTVRVDGAVNRPGLMAYVEERTANEYVGLAGGPTRRGDAGDARLTRSGSGHTVFARDMARIEPGDFIWVPEKKDTSFWASFRDAVIVTAQVATIILVIDQLSK